MALTASQRRAFRRARAKARLRWYLHQRGLVRLGPGALAHLRGTLAKHHSADRKFLARIAGAMASKPQPWRCRTCMKTAKPSMPRCAWCGKNWQEVMDTSFRPPQPQEGSHSQGYGGGAQNNRARSTGRGQNAPRRRSRKHGKGNHGSGQQEHAPLPQQGPPAQFYPPGNWQVYGQTGPYPVQQMQQATPQALAPPPPPPMPKAPGGAPENMWLQQMQQMPVLATATAQAASNANRQVPMSQAELHLQAVLGALRQTPETPWTPEVQLAVQKVDQQEVQHTLTQVESSVRALGLAKQAVADAEANRLRLISSWRTFLQYSVDRWKEYTALFQAQEADTQAQIQNARVQLAAAQKKFGESSEAAVKDEVHSISDDDAADGTKSVHDAEMRTEATKRISDGLNNVVNSLQELSDQAEAEEHKSKRHRTQEAPDPGAALPSSTLPSMQPFGQAGAK